MPQRPSRVPDEAVWNVADCEWELGTTLEGRRQGPWRWWRPDGTLVCESHFDAAGQLHGRCRRYHPAGDISYIAHYDHGVKHGKEVVRRPDAGTSDQPTREARGATTEVGALALEQINSGLYRLESLWLAGELRATTLYNKEGSQAPLKSDAHGHVKNLGQQLHKLLGGTSLSLTAPFLRTLGAVSTSPPAPGPGGLVASRGGALAVAASLRLPAKIPSSMVREARYVCLAVRGGTLHRVEIVDHEGRAHLAIVDAAAFGALTLTVELLLHDLGIEEETS